GRLYGRPYGLYGPVRMRSTRNIFSQPSEDIWCLCKNKAQGYGLRIMVSKEHQEDVVCNGNLRELAHGWLMIVQDRLDGRLYGRPYGLYGPVRMRSTRNIFSQPSEDIWCLCKNRAHGYGLRIMVSKEHQEDVVCNGNLRELAHGSDWLMIVQDRLDVAGKKETKGGY
ncbi:hypothetical protein HID58_066910, partial [Brassica napus]